MLDEVGYTVDYIQQTITTSLPSLKEHLEDHNYNIDGLSLIDPACGSGTFLYKSAGRIVHAMHNIQKETHITDEQAGKITELLICNNIV
jgi:type I restriction-modification system DNA methylase subunit